MYAVSYIVEVNSGHKGLLPMTKKKSMWKYLTCETTCSNSANSGVIRVHVIIIKIAALGKL